jgi:uncharacterized membrane protein YeiB
MSLTAYVGHFAVQSMLPLLGDEAPPWRTLIMFVLGSMLFAVIWSRFFRRGPLEYLLHTAAKPAKFVR